MRFKRLSAAALALVMAASLPAAFAAPADGARGPLQVVPISAQLPEPVDLPLPASYQSQLFLNGEALDASAIPGVAPNLVPMRLLCEADGGMAQWYEEDNQAFFYLANQRIIISFADNSVELEFEPVEGVKATLVDGVTFLPASFINTLEGVEVNENPELDVDRIDVKTPNGTPLMKLAYQVMESANMGMGMKQSVEQMVEFYGENFGFNEEMMTEGVGFFPMLINADALILFRMADESKEEEIRAAFEAYQANELERCNWGYLVNNLPVIENAQIVFEGDWALFLIAENAEAGAETFRAAVQAMNETQE